MHTRKREREMKENKASLHAARPRSFLSSTTTSLSSKLVFSVSPASGNYLFHPAFLEFRVFLFRVFRKKKISFRSPIKQFPSSESIPSSLSQHSKAQSGSSNRSKNTKSTTHTMSNTAACSSSSSARIASSTTRSLSSKRQFAQKSSSSISRSIRRVVAADSSAASSPSSATAAAEKPEPELKSDVSGRFLVFFALVFCFFVRVSLSRARFLYVSLLSLRRRRYG